MTEMTGIQALLTAASRCRVAAVYGVPGSPITDAVQTFADSCEFAAVTRWFANEKAAFEWGLGTSFAGRRSLVAVKHVGMNILADPLMTAVIHTVGAGLVILAGDDPEVSGSQNSQDTRFYGSLARTLVYDPAVPQDIYDYLEQAFRMSEKLKIPVIVRLTDAVLKDTRSVRLSESVYEVPEIGCDPSVWQYRMKGRYQRSHFVNDDLLSKAADRLCRVENDVGSGQKIGVIASGKCFDRVKAVIASVRRHHPSLTPASFAVMKLGIVSPLPASLIRQFLERHGTVLVVEESEPFIEDRIRIFGGVLGKRSGHLPFGNVGEEDILLALEHLSDPSVCRSRNIEIYKRAADKPYFCEGCLYPRFYGMLGRLKAKAGVPVSGDIGCSMYGAVAPYSVLDSAVSLGSSIGIGSGISVSEGRKSIAVIGDFGFFHSGLIGLVEAAAKGVPLLVFVMANSAAAMTGGQEADDPEVLISAALAGGSNRQNSLYSFDLGEMTDNGFEETFNNIYALGLNELKKDCLSVILIRWKCLKK